jgi:hypothetical protein
MYSFSSKRGGFCLVYHVSLVQNRYGTQRVLGNYLWRKGKKPIKEGRKGKGKKK